MQFTHHHHFHFDPQVEARLRAVEFKLDLILTNQERLMDELKAQIESNKTVIASALALINGIADRITAAGTDKQQLADLAASLKSDDDALAAAVAANTPAA